MKRSDRLRRRLAVDHSDETAYDGEVVRVPMTFMDTALRDDLARRFPPVTAASSMVDAAKITEALLATQAVMQRDHETMLAQHMPGFRGTVDAVDFSASDKAYKEGVAAMADAWKDAPSVGAPAPKLLPFGAWKLGSQTEGASCSVGEGDAGVWTREGDYLYCKPKPMPSARSGDAALTGRDLVDASWLALQERQRNAWRT